ncbi:MAG: hypothetical protein KDE04_25570, partial [Anaerolineales bacterium]|nr:hypothetical protein [Anaerolineales bacterium]
YPVNQSTPGVLNLGPTVTLVPAGTSHPLPPAGLPPLHFLTLASRLSDLYEMVFPDRLDWLEQEPVAWTDEEAIAAAVERFLGRVNTLFPVQADIWDIELESIAWRLDEIPIMPMGFDLWHDDWSDLYEPAPYLLTMQYEREALADLYPDHPVPAGLDPSQLADALRQAGSSSAELAALPDLLAMLDQDTGNAWLDIGEISLAEGGGYPTWSRENVAWLAAEWRQAQPIVDRVFTLLNWKNESAASSAEKLTLVRDALVSAHARRQTHDPADAAAPPA